MSDPSYSYGKMHSFAACAALIKRDITVMLRSPDQIMMPLAFFLMVTALFPLGISPEKETLALIAPGVIWIGALLSVLLSLDALFKDDQYDGALETLLLSPHPLPLLVLAKVFAHWLMSGLCVTLIAPLLAVMSFLPADVVPVLLLTLLLGTPILSLIGAVTAALTARTQRGSGLLVLLSLPLLIPVLIFACGAVQAAIQQMPYMAHLSWLGAFLLFALCFAPIASAAALRNIGE